MTAQTKKRLLPVWAIVLLDIVALGAALVVFSLFHHVLPSEGGGPVRDILASHSSAPSSSSASTSTGAASVSSSSVAPPAIGDFSASFPDYDTGVGKEGSYQSDNVRIAVDRIERDGITYFVADIWIRDIRCLRTAFAQGKYGKSITDTIDNIAADNGALLAMTGDYYGARSKGIVIRNGLLYRDTLFEDVCVLYVDGTMETFEKRDFNIDDAIAAGAYQAWSFGPQLLEGGQPMTSFNSAVRAANPRSAIGYYEPGHYCFVVVDGRQEGYSKGMKMSELSQTMYDLGCEAAYNLDGGQTAALYFDGGIINRPYLNGRRMSDIVYIGEPQ